MSEKAPKTRKQWAKNQIFRDCLEARDGLAQLISWHLVHQRDNHNTSGTNRVVEVDIAFDDAYHLEFYLDNLPHEVTQDEFYEFINAADPIELIHAALSLGYIEQASRCSQALETAYAQCPRLER